MWQDNKEQIGLNDRFEFIGNLERGDYGLELKSAQLDDSGVYICQVTPDKLADNDNKADFAIKTNITVVPVPPTKNIPPYWTKLVAESPGGPNSVVSSPSPSLQPAAFMSQKSPSSAFHYLSTRASSSSASSVRHHQHQSATVAALTLSWPYLLLALAGLLMLANIYLIYALIKRHKRACRSRSEIKS